MRPSQRRGASTPPTWPSTTEYVFRGISQTKEGPAIQGGYDLTCNIFYAGVWASNLDWGGTGLFGFPGNEAVANIEMDWYLGIKPVTGRITWDLGVIYYTYPNSAQFGLDGSLDVTKRDYNYLELKVGASAEIWKDGTVGVTVFYSPDYQYEAGSVWTTEYSFTQVFPKFNALHRDWTPSFSALLGWQKATSDKAVYINNVTGDRRQLSLLERRPDPSASSRSGRSTSATGTPTSTRRLASAAAASISSPATSGSWRP